VSALEKKVSGEICTKESKITICREGGRAGCQKKDAWQGGKVEKGVIGTNTQARLRRGEVERGVTWKTGRGPHPLLRRGMSPLGEKGSQERLLEKDSKCTEKGNGFTPNSSEEDSMCSGEVPSCIS